MIKYKKRDSAKAGLPPGSVVYIGNRVPLATQVKMHIYNTDTYQCLDGFHAEHLQKALQTGMTVWVDICGLSDTALINHIGSKLSFHDLVIEDMVNTRQRPKLEFYDDYLFIVFKLLDSSNDDLLFEQEQISLLMRKQLLMSVRESDKHSLASIYRDCQNNPSYIRTHGVEYLLYSVMDDLIDKYFHLVEESSNHIESMEDLAINEPDAINPKEVYMIKRRIIHLRKIITPLRDICHALLKEANAFISKSYLVYYRDLFDHTARLIESINFHHELTTETLSIYVSFVNTRMNQTMKILTLFASLFIPLNFIVGLYGMNFVVMPILKWQHGFHAVLICMSMLVILMLYYFKRKKLY